MRLRSKTAPKKSNTAQTIRKKLKTPSYLEPNRNTMQKPIEGRSVMALFTTISMQKTAKRRFHRFHQNYEQISKYFI